MKQETTGCHRIDTLTRYVGYIAGITVALLVLLVVYDALVRYLFQSGSVALQELEWHLFDVIILLGIGYALRQDAHVRVDIFYDRFSLRHKAWINLISMLCFVLPFSFLIVYVGLDFVLLSFDQMESSSNPGGLSYRFIIKSFMPLAFVLLALQGVAEIRRCYHTLKGIA